MDKKGYTMDELGSGDIIWSKKPASEWPEFYPIGNGRIGGMVSGWVHNERIALNHDLLWRTYMTYQEHKTGGDIAKIRDCCTKGLWDEADDIILRRIPFTGKAIYINPYVPVGDLFIDMMHEQGEIEDYVRILDMDCGMAVTKYRIGDTAYRREAFCSWEKGIMAIRLSADAAAKLTGEVSLSRLQDPECMVSGHSGLGIVTMEGEFEEGRRFAAAVRIIQRGGRLTAGRKEYIQSAEGMPEKDFGLSYIFSNNDMYIKREGASTFFDSSDEVLILVSIAVDEEAKEGADLSEVCIGRLFEINEGYDTLLDGHILSHRKLYRKMSFKLGCERDERATDRILADSMDEDAVSLQLIEKLFNMARYLAISSGRPQPGGMPSKSPINLQGIWNQDRRPAWECDFHLDLNVEMCYWPLDILNLDGLMEPLMDWAERLSEGGRKAAKDLYGCGGLAFTSCCDYRNLGRCDNVLFLWTGAAAWIAQILWHHWECTRDEEFLKNRLYPFMLEIGMFYKDFLYEDKDGNLLPSLSVSPEMWIKGRKRMSFISSASTMDLELIRDILTHLVQAGVILGEEHTLIEKWKGMIEKVPFPGIGKDGSLNEFMEDHTPGDPGHRHRSHLVGLCPGERITVEDTPDHAQAAYLAVKKRHRYGRDMTQSLTFVWDAQLLARLYRAEEAFDEIRRMFQVHVLDNLLITCNDWSGAKGGLSWFTGTKLFQIEASIGAAGAIIEMMFQDMRGVMRFLPALPKVMDKGKVTGIKANGGFEVDIKWDGGRLREAKIRSSAGGRCTIKNNEQLYGAKITRGNSRLDITPCDDNICFDTEKGGEYIISF